MGNLNMDINDIHPYLKLIESICLKRCGYLEEGHECYVFVLDKLKEDHARRVRQYRGKSAFKTYLIAVTHRLIIDFIRHRRGRFTDPTSAAERNPRPKNPLRIDDAGGDGCISIPDSSPGPEELLFLKESEAFKSKAGAVAQQFLAELPPEDRLILMMKIMDGFKISTIAKTLSLNQRALYRRIKRLTTQLKKGLLERGINMRDVHGTHVE